MQRALDLSQGGLGRVSPNPLVGCVIVHHDHIIAEGWHAEYGGPHAEVTAINSVKDKSVLNESEVFVTLEPCTHFGKTPPCADLLVQNNVRRVVVAANDSNPIVSGKGIKRMQDHGINVTANVLEKEAKWVNRRFFSLHEKKRPYVILKWAQTSDGFIARENYDSKWISSDISRKLVHKWRSEEDAILVGRNTVLYDNPSLTTRDWSGSDPIRMVLDPQLSLASDFHVFDGTVKTFVYNQREEKSKGWIEFIKCGSNFINDILSDAAQRGISSIFVEGGSATLKAFIGAGAWDEARVFESDSIFGKGISAPVITGSVATEKIGNDNLKYYKNNN